MLTVYLVEKTTRIILPESRWGEDVLAKLTQSGLQVEMTGEDPESCHRDEVEMARVHAILDSLDV